ncbi:MAG: flagellar biosynthesis repressor FlbT [Pseudomonadota bacterium]
MTARFSLSEGAGIYVNGALVRADRRVRLDVDGARRLLLETHVVPTGANDDAIADLAAWLQAGLIAAEPRQIAEFANSADYRQLLHRARAAAPARCLDALLAEAHRHVLEGRNHQALRLLRKTSRPPRGAKSAI